MQKQVNMPSTVPPPSKREDIIRVAYDAFDKHGFIENGIDKVFAASGISKRTVYKHFSSKEELIAAAIAHYQMRAFEKIQKELGARTFNAKEKLLLLFEMKREELSKKDYSGCFAINAGLAYQGKSALIRTASCTFLREAEKMIASLCREADCSQPAVTAMQIMIIFQGTILHGQAHHNPRAATAARKAVQALLEGLA